MCKNTKNKKAIFERANARSPPNRANCAHTDLCANMWRNRPDRRNLNRTHVNSQRANSTQKGYAQRNNVKIEQIRTHPSDRMRFSKEKRPRDDRGKQNARDRGKQFFLQIIFLICLCLIETMNVQSDPRLDSPLIFLSTPRAGERISDSLSPTNSRVK